MASYRRASDARRGRNERIVSDSPSAWSEDDDLYENKTTPGFSGAPPDTDGVIIDGDASGLVRELPESEDSYGAEPVTQPVTQVLIIYQGPQDEESPRVRFFNVHACMIRRKNLASLVGSALIAGSVIWAAFAVAIPWLFYPTAVVTISPSVRSVNATFTVAFAEVGGRQLPPVTQSRSMTVAATGTQTQQATKASGLVTLTSFSNSPTVIGGGAIIASQDGQEFTTDSTVTIPVGNPGQVTVSVHATRAGSQGNIAASAINEDCCSFNVHVKNYSAFSGGQDASTYQAVAQDDIQNATNTLKPSVDQGVAEAVQNQIQSSEQLASAPVCSDQVSSSPSIGAKATQVEVTVKETCTGLAYNAAKMQAYAIDRLGQGSGGFTLVSETVQIKSTMQGTSELKTQASGQAYYQWSNSQLHHLAKDLVGRSVLAGVGWLSAQRGIYSVSYSVWGRDQTTFPLDAARIQVVTKSLIIVP